MARTRLYPPSVDPGFPELPPTPNGWNRSKFKNLVEAVERPIKLDPDSTYRLLTAKRSRGGITLRGELKGREILTKTQFSSHAGDFLISRRQIIHGACGVVPEALHGAVVSNEYSTLRTRADLIMGFLRHLSHTAYFQRTCFHSSHGVDVEKMVFKLDQWLDWPVNVPPLGEQRKITAILSSVDDVIEATQAVIDQLQVVKKAMMAELLTRGLPGRHTRFKKTEIGEVPEEWELAPLAECLREPIRNGYSPVCPSNPTGRWVLHVGAVTFDGFNPRALKPAPLDDQRLDSAVVEEGDLLVSRSNTRERVGLAGVCRGLPDMCSYPDLLMRVRLTSRLLPDFLELLLLSVRGRDYMSGAARGTSESMVKINRDILAAFQVPLPNIEEQQKIVEVIHSVLRKREMELAVRDSLQTLKSALLSALFTGEIRVTPDPDEAAP
jgi:type I restriction enzyme, S subunit